MHYTHSSRFHLFSFFQKMVMTHTVFKRQSKITIFSVIFMIFFFLLFGVRPVWCVFLEELSSARAQPHEQGAAAAALIFHLLHYPQGRAARGGLPLAHFVPTHGAKRNHRPSCRKARAETCVDLKMAWCVRRSGFESCAVCQQLRRRAEPRRRAQMAQHMGDFKYEQHVPFVQTLLFNQLDKWSVNRQFSLSIYF